MPSRRTITVLIAPTFETMLLTTTPADTTADVLAAIHVHAHIAATATVRYSISSFGPVSWAVFCATPTQILLQLSPRWPLVVHVLGRIGWGVTLGPKRRHHRDDGPSPKHPKPNVRHNANRIRGALRIPDVIDLTHG
ncbi:hypothetical protein HK104_006467 [Borealophlyctis nickersoniae]|nr:hypothetical protein HK104_006467 [Borealophlyctis nickersoniae]